MLQNAFAVTGAVKRPAIYETKDNITFNQALELAGDCRQTPWGRYRSKGLVRGKDVH